MMLLVVNAYVRGNKLATNAERVETYLKQLQDSICQSLEALDGKAKFYEESWQRPEGGGGRTRVMSDGAVFEKAGVNFSLVHGATMPASATANRPELAGAGFKAMGVSLVIHPHNPKVPTTHANVRFFIAEKEGVEPVFWFGGGYDLTPYYPYREDVVAWHSVAKKACDPHNPEYYPKFKKWCDEYFYLPHRNETRGVGGLFFDDLNSGDFEADFSFLQSVGNSFIEAYQPIVEKRQHEAFTEQQKQFQLYRRGRYVEFNLVYDRGTLFGLQSNGRTESILMSLPPLVRFDYGFEPKSGSKEADLYDNYLKPQTWL